MNKSIATAALSFLTISSLAAGLNTQVKAFAAQTIYSTEKSSSTPQLIEKASEQTTTEVAQAMTCESRYVNGTLVSCCMDSDGNWSCVW